MKQTKKLKNRLPLPPSSTSPSSSSSPSPSLAAAAARVAGAADVAPSSSSSGRCHRFRLELSGFAVVDESVLRDGDEVRLVVLRRDGFAGGNRGDGDSGDDDGDGGDDACRLRSQLGLPALSISSSDAEVELLSDDSSSSSSSSSSSEDDSQTTTRTATSCKLSILRGDYCSSSSRVD